MKPTRLARRVVDAHVARPRLDDRPRQQRYRDSLVALVRPMASYP